MFRLLLCLLRFLYYIERGLSPSSGKLDAMEKINVSRIDMQALMQPITPSLRVGVLQYLKYCSICITENISSYFRYQIFSKRKFFNLIIRSLILGNYIPNQSTKSTTISSIMTDVQSNLPRVRPDDLPLFDEASQTMCGFLKKQAGQSSTFSKGWKRHSHHN